MTWHAKLITGDTLKLTSRYDTLTEQYIFGPGILDADDEDGRRVSASGKYLVMLWWTE